MQQNFCFPFRTLEYFSIRKQIHKYNMNLDFWMYTAENIQVPIEMTNSSVNEYLNHSFVLVLTRKPNQKWANHSLSYIYTLVGLTLHTVHTICNRIDETLNDMHIIVSLGTRISKT